MKQPESAARPPTMCTAPDPAKSIAPELNSRFAGWDLRRAQRNRAS